MPGSYDLGYTPGSTAVGKSKFSPSAIGEGLLGGRGLDIGGLLNKAAELKRQQAEDEMERNLRYDQAMRLRDASGRHSRTQNAPMPLRDMMQTKSVLDAMTPFNTAGGTNTEFRNMPAAASLTGMQLPQSGWDVYTRLAAAGPAPDVQGQAQAQSLQAQTQGLGQLFPRSGTLADAMRFGLGRWAPQGG